VSGSTRTPSSCSSHGLESAEREVRWLTELIDTERASNMTHLDDRTGRSARPLLIRATDGRAVTKHCPVIDTTMIDSHPSHPPRVKEHRMGSVRVAIVGVGNCAASLVQGVHYYRDADPSSTVPGLMHVQFGDYHVRDIEFVAAFDVDAKKVGFDLADAIVSSENNTIKICDVPPLGVTVQRGHTFDGLGKYYRETITESDEQPVDIVQALKDAQVDVLISYLPVGSEEADKHYAQCAIDAGVAFVNALPVFIASDQEWAQKFSDAGVPIIGDDIKSQVGATITHRVLARLFEERGVVLDRTYQLNVGGTWTSRTCWSVTGWSRRRSPRPRAVTSNITHDLGAKNVHIGPSDYVQWLDDRKWAYVRLEGRAFGDVPLSLEYKLEVWDSPNSAGVIIDALRARRSPRTAVTAVRCSRPRPTS
jgi:myo-inositol-1-phosphate synthase